MPRRKKSTSDADSKKTTQIEKLKKELDELAGKDINISPDRVIRFVVPIAAYEYSYGWQSEPSPVSWITSRFLLDGKACSKTRLFDVAGNAFTGADGKRVFLLSDFLCETENTYLEPVNLIATPRSENPCYTTTTWKLVPDVAHGNPNLFIDVEITVFTWNPDGSPAPNVSVDWRCWVGVPVPF
jgi:hypothetical protein